MEFKTTLLAAASALVAAGCLPPITEHPSDPAPKKGAFQPPQQDAFTQVFEGEGGPYGSVCRPNIRRRRGYVLPKTFHSSGALLPDGILLTAAHNYYSPSLSRVVKASVQCGASRGPDTPYAYAASDSFRRELLRTHDGYTWKPFDADMAVVKLCDKKAPQSAFRFPTAEEIEAIKEKREVFIAGYPGKGSTMQHVKTTLTKITPWQLEYQAKTEKGLSGSPVWFETKTEGDGEPEYVVIGVHVRPSGAYRITEDSLRMINRWKAELDRACRNP